MFFYRKISGRLLLHFSIDLLIFLPLFWSSIKKCFFNSLINRIISRNYADCLLIFNTQSHYCYLLLTIYLYSKNWGLIFKITCLLWVKEERTVFFFLLFFCFYCLLPLRFQSEQSTCFLMLSIYENKVCIRQILHKNMIGIWNIFNMVAECWCSVCIFLWWFFKILKNFISE